MVTVTERDLQQLSDSDKCRLMKLLIARAAIFELEKEIEKQQKGGCAND